MNRMICRQQKYRHQQLCTQRGGRNATRSDPPSPHPRLHRSHCVLEAWSHRFRRQGDSPRAPFVCRKWCVCCLAFELLSNLLLVPTSPWRSGHVGCCCSKSAAASVRLGLRDIARAIGLPHKKAQSAHLPPLRTVTQPCVIYTLKLTHIKYRLYSRDEFKNAKNSFFCATRQVSITTEISCAKATNL